ncbi:dihydroorotase [Gemmatimonadota bacterium]
MPGILIQNGRVIDPSQNLDTETDVVIDRGRIEALAKVGKGAKANFASVFDASGMVVCPGLIDMHVHLREPGEEHKETIASGAAAAAAGGFTGVGSMPNTHPPTDDASRLGLVLEKAADARFNVYPFAAISMGREGKSLTEMAELVEMGAAGFTDDGSTVADSHLMRTALEYSSMLGVPIAEHCEDKALTVLGSMHEGLPSAILGVRGVPGIAEDVIVARDLIIAEYTGGHLHIQHVSTARSVALIREAKKRGVHVSCEVCPHHLTLTDEDVRDSALNTNFKMYPPLRSREDVQALRKALKNGVIDLIASDHAPHHLDDKDTTFEDACVGIVGLETTLGVILNDLVRGEVIDLKTAIALMSTRPAEVFGLDAGTLRPGTEANVTIFDPAATWTVDPEQFRSKGRNTPWAGSSLTGKATAVVVKGRLLSA